MDVSTIINSILCILSFVLAVISVYTEEINVGTPFFYLVVKNFGKSSAYITRFEYDFDFKGCNKIKDAKDYLYGLNQAVLAPGQSRICMLDYDKINRDVTFTINYQSAMKKEYSETITID